MNESISLILFREIFQCSVLLSFWRVRHAWHKNVLKKCVEIEKRAEILRQLGQAVDRVCRGDEKVDLFEQLIKDQVDDPDLIDYFRATWCPRLGLSPSPFSNNEVFLEKEGFQFIMLAEFVAISFIC